MQGDLSKKSEFELMDFLVGPDIARALCRGLLALHRGVSEALHRGV